MKGASEAERWLRKLWRGMARLEASDTARKRVNARRAMFALVRAFRNWIDRRWPSFRKEKSVPLTQQQWAMREKLSRAARTLMMKLTGRQTMFKVGETPMDPTAFRRKLMHHLGYLAIEEYKLDAYDGRNPEHCIQVAEDRYSEEVDRLMKRYKGLFTEAALSGWK